MTVVFLGIWWPPLCNCWFGCERVKVSMECSYPQSGTVEPQDIWMWPGRGLVQRALFGDQVKGFMCNFSIPPAPVPSGEFDSV